MRGGRGYSRGGGGSSYSRGGSSSSYRGGVSSSGFRGGAANYNSGSGRSSTSGTGRYNSNTSYNSSTYDSTRNTSRYDEPERGRPAFKRSSYNDVRDESRGSDRGIDDRKRYRYEGGSAASRGGGSSSRRGGGHDGGFRTSSSGRDYSGGGGGGAGGNRFDSSSRSTNHVVRRSSPVHHSSHHHGHHAGSSRPSSGGGGGAGGGSSYRARESSSGSARGHRDPEAMGPPSQRMPPPRVIRGRGRILSSSSISMRGRGSSIRSSSSIRGRIGRVDGGRPLGPLRRRIVTTTAIRSRELLQFKTSKIRSLALKRMSRPAKKSGAEDGEESTELDVSAEQENGDTSKDDVAGGEETVVTENGEKAKKNAPIKKEKEDGEDKKKETSSTEASESKKRDKAETTDAGEVVVKKEAVGGAEVVVDGKKADKAVVADSPSKKSTTSERKEGKAVSPIRYKRSYIKLACPHCPSASTRTFKDYSRHLKSESHRLTLTRVSLKLKHQLLKMRTAQRNAQRETDQTEDNDTVRSAFCLLCRLNHRQSKAVHNASDGHKNMIRFQRPKCSICMIYFKSPYMYETHRCSLEHIRNKSRSDGLRTDDENSDAEVERDLENFTTVDSVGDVDDEDAGDLAEKSEQDAQEDDINIGIEHVNKVEVYYCDLCRYYLPPRDEIDTRIKRHCQSRAHLRAYLQFKDDELLRQDAERLARKRPTTTTTTAKKDSKVKREDDATVPVEGTEKTVENGEEAERAEGEGKPNDVAKTDVAESVVTENGKDEEEEVELELTAADEIVQDEDRDVSDMLERSNYEDDEDSKNNSERYDRFRYSGDGGEEDEEQEAEVHSPGSAAKEIGSAV